jgi:hypothetical protein
MQQRYIVLHDGMQIGNVVAETAEQAIEKVCFLTGHAPGECTAMPAPR